MSAVLNLSTEQRSELFTQAGVELGLPAFYVEKYFWERRACRTVVRDQIFPLIENQVEELGGGASARLVEIDQARDPFIVEVEYPRVDLGPGRGYQRPLVKVELSGRADSWPEDSRSIAPYVAQASLCVNI